MAGLFISAGFPAAARAVGEVGRYTVFAGQGINLTGGLVVPYGSVGSNGNVAIGTFSHIGGGVGGGGDFNSAAQSPGASTVGGPITFNGNVYMGSFDTVVGPINIGASAVFGSSLNASSDITAGQGISASFSTINGTVRAGGDVNFTTSFDTITGNVFGNGNVNLQGTVNGNVTYGNTLTTGGFTHITGSTTHGTVIVSPASYVAQSVPAADVFTSGGANVTNGGSAATPLPPGSYGDLGFTSFADLYLGPGNYYFNSLAFNGLTSLHFVNLTPTSHINIYSTGDISGSLFFPTVNGVDFSQVDPSLAANVSLETLGNYSLDSSMFGSIFAPNGSVTLTNFETVYSNVIAGATINAGTITVLPEQASLGLLALTAPLLLRRRRRFVCGQSTRRRCVSSLPPLESTRYRRAAS
jgi:hypothetical protein